jgi:hypothetical protein
MELLPARQNEAAVTVARSPAVRSPAVRSPEGAVTGGAVTEGAVTASGVARDEAKSGALTARRFEEGG